jgi:hypothetical protein
MLGFPDEMAKPLVTDGHEPVTIVSRRRVGLRPLLAGAGMQASDP